MPSQWMQLAINAAEAVRGTTSPNPWVGAVLVRDGQLIATGATNPPGGDHAEATALAGHETEARGADLYVTLEPCAPFEGKRTRPCAERIIEAGVARVVVALEDPDPRVGGRGIALLRNAGIEVETGDGAPEARAALRPYFKHRETGTPWVIAKFAASLDGRTATATGDSKWITGEAARDRAHHERARVDAILAGSGTVLADDPSLTARPGGQLAEHQPACIIVDARGRISPTAKLFDAPANILVATTPESRAEWRSAITAAGAQLLVGEPGPTGGINLPQLLGALGQRGILTLWAEGGATLLGSLFEADLVDEAWAFLAPKLLGSDARPAIEVPGPPFVRDAWQLHETTVEQLGDDVLVRGLTRPA